MVVNVRFGGRKPTFSIWAPWFVTGGVLQKLLELLPHVEDRYAVASRVLGLIGVIGTAGIQVGGMRAACCADCVRADFIVRGTVYKYWLAW